MPAHARTGGSDERHGSERHGKTRMHRETVEMLKGLSPQGVPMTAWKVYLALLEVPRPPLYGVTGQELRRHSVA